MDDRGLEEVVKVSSSGKGAPVRPGPESEVEERKVGHPVPR